jgi:uncharacterized protein YbgA (DUF1722 family)
MAHNPMQYKTLGNLLGNMGQSDPAEIGPRYFSELMSALKKCRHPPHPHQRSAASQRLSETGHQRLRQTGSPDVIGQYRHGIVPLVVPLTLLKHHFRQHPDPYIALQVYLQPHPENLSLRNAI